MKKNLLFVILVSLISLTSQAQFNTEKSSFDFNTEFTADTVNYSVTSVKSITFVNKGDQTAMIDSVYYLEPNEFLTLGGNKGAQVNDTFNIYFTGSGTKKVNVIKETVSSY